MNEAPQTRVSVPGNPVKLSAHAQRWVRSPGLNEHAAEILADWARPAG